MCAHGHSWAFISMVLWHNECSWVMMSAHGPMVSCPWLFLSSHECSLLHGPSSWVFMASPIRFSWAIMGTHEHSLAFMGTNKQPRAAMSVLDYHWTLMSSHEHSWAWCHGAMSTHQSTRAVVSMAPQGYERSSALRSTHGTIAPYSWVLLGTHGHTRALLGAHEHSWQVMSAELFYQTINKKC